MMHACNIPLSLQLYMHTLCHLTSCLTSSNFFVPHFTLHYILLLLSLTLLPPPLPSLHHLLTLALFDRTSPPLFSPSLHLPFPFSHHILCDCTSPYRTLQCVVECSGKFFSPCPSHTKKLKTESKLCRRSSCPC